MLGKEALNPCLAVTGPVTPADWSSAAFRIQYSVLVHQGLDSLQDRKNEFSEPNAG